MKKRVLFALIGVTVALFMTSCVGTTAVVTPTGVAVRPAAVVVATPVRVVPAPRVVVAPAPRVVVAPARCGQKPSIAPATRTSSSSAPSTPSPLTKVLSQTRRVSPLKGETLFLYLYIYLKEFIPDFR